MKTKNTLFFLLALAPYSAHSSIAKEFAKYLAGYGISAAVGAGAAECSGRYVASQQMATNTKSVQHDIMAQHHEKSIVPEVISDHLQMACYAFCIPTTMQILHHCNLIKFRKSWIEPLKKHWKIITYSYMITFFATGVISGWNWRHQQAQEYHHTEYKNNLPWYKKLFNNK